MNREQRKHYEDTSFAASIIMDESARFAKPRPHVENPVQDAALQYRTFLETLKPTEEHEVYGTLSDLMTPALKQGVYTHMLLERFFQADMDESIWMIDAEHGSYMIPGDLFHGSGRLGKSAFAVLNGDREMPHCQSISVAGSRADSAIHGVMEWVSEVFPDGNLQSKHHSSLPHLTNESSLIDGLYFSHPRHPRLDLRYSRPEKG